MRVLYLNSADIEGGAARAASRLLQGVHGHGVDAQLYVQRRRGSDPLVDGPGSLLGKTFGRLRPTIEQALCGINPARINGPFCAACLPEGLATLIDRRGPDIVHLHWVARMMRIETLALIRKPLVWTMHDSWAFTGGCYLPGDCTRYRTSCGACPVLNSTREHDLSRRVWERKQRAWEGLDLTIIAPSHDMATAARSSSLFRDKRIEVIPNGIDVQTFKQHDKQSARKRFCLPLNRKLILFGAKSATIDRNKGFHLLREALNLLPTDVDLDAVDLVVFGSAEPDKLTNLGIRVHNLGWQDDDAALAQLYSAGDVFVMPSLHESLGYMAMEAMACGIPCVAFRQGGVPDLIDHGQNGYMARPFEIGDLAQGISWMLADDTSNSLSVKARSKIVNEFALEKTSERHIALYRDIL